MIRAISTALVLLTALSTMAAAQPNTGQIAARALEKRASPRTVARVSGVVQQLVAELRAQRAAGQKPDERIGTGRRVPVTIRFRNESRENARSILAAFGIVPANEMHAVVEAYVPVAVLEALALRNEILAIDALVPARPHVAGQGATVHNASTWQAAGRAGAGVKVGVIDVGFEGLSALIGTELPSGVVGRCYSAVGAFTASLGACEVDSNHGTAVAEALADVSPGVQLYVANPISPLDLHSTVAWMTSQGVKVINHSVGWTWSGPGDGTTPFADAPLRAIDAAVSAGAFWTNSAGNNAFTTWSGPYADFDGDDVMEFQGVTDLNAVSLTAGEMFIAQARWDDSWTAAARDLDLYLLNSNGDIVALSQGEQSGTFGGIPFEILAFTPAQSGSYYLVVARFQGGIPQWVDVQAFSGEPLQFSTSAHSIADPADTGNPGAVAVGAVPWYDTSTIEPFSSRGPTRDGRTKPDLVAADRADSVTYGANGFLGSSQATPHVAGLAALLLETFPTTSPRLVAQYLRAVSSPRGSPNTTFGWGFAQLPVFPATVSLSALLPSTTFPAPAGEPMTWTAFAIGGQSPFEYKFWLFRQGIGWSVLQDYSASNSVAWTPPAPGTYALQVWVRRVGSAATYDAWRGSDFFAIGPAAPVSVASPTPNVALPVAHNTTITWTATASGGVAPLQYQFWRFRQGFGWSMVQDYSPTNTFTWTPAASEAGTYALQVWVRSAGSTAQYDGWAATSFFDILGPPPVAVLNLFANVTFPAPIGTPITWAATATGGVAQLEYKFWRLKLSEGWTAVQEYSTLGTYSWTPGPGDAGTYAIQVWVRQVGSSASYEAWRGTDLFEITGPPAARLTSFTGPAAGTAGIAMTWSATGSGGTPPLHYKFWLNAGGVWTVPQDYSTLASVTWTPTLPGTYALQVWVRSSGSSAAFEDWRGTGFFTVSSSPTAFVSSLTADVSFPATVNSPITWTAIGGGGTAPLQYKFWRLKQGVGWTMVQDYSPNATYTWTPAPGDEGSYALQVWIRSAGSTATYEGWRGTDFFQIVP